ncbi:MAG: hypothetical protein HYR56_12630 [Acidobacteria bacterium]|nr:hypothetical protein [Acidobacteriota bacterium]MBI3425498.1 hypothetical protein [Acidobacteriota bacterium]
MSYFKSCSLAVVVCALGLCGVVAAQVPVKVQKAELSINFGVAKGRLVTAGEQLIFVDEEMPDASFAIDKGNIKGWNEQEGVITVDTNKNVKDRSGERNRFAFRLVEGSGAGLAAWYKETVMAKPADALAKDVTASTDKPGQKIYQARKDNLLGKTTGKLIIMDNMIHFESAEGLKYSRQWELKDVKTVKQTGPYILEIEPFSGEKYKLELLGEGMTPAEFKALSDRVGSARVKQ